MLERSPPAFLLKWKALTSKSSVSHERIRKHVLNFVSDFLKRFVCQETEGHMLSPTSAIPWKPECHGELQEHKVAPREDVVLAHGEVFGDQLFVQTTLPPSAEEAVPSAAAQNRS